MKPREYNDLLEKSKAGYKDLVSVANDNSFKIETEGVKITFILDKYFQDTYAIYQIFE